jgi:FkbM family methyltransferase
MTESLKTQADLSRILSFAGEVELAVDGIALRFDCSQPHERRYLVRELFGLPYPQADVDSFLLRLLVRPGDVCLDAGANIGMTAIEMLRLGASRVLAFEPVPPLVARLRRINDRRLKVSNLALGRTAGSAEILLSASHNQGHTLKDGMTLRFPEVFGSEPQRLPVQVDSIDGLGKGRRSGSFGAVWKIDVEGAELDVIQGAARTLRRSPPRSIFCETYDPPEPLLEALGKDWLAYRAFIAREPYGLVLGPFGMQQDQDLHFDISPTFLFLHAAQMDGAMQEQIAALLEAGAPQARSEAPQSEDSPSEDPMTP